MPVFVEAQHVYIRLRRLVEVMLPPIALRRWQNL
jgi:hypothetical protein